MMKHDDDRDFSTGSVLYVATTSLLAFRFSDEMLFNSDSDMI